MLINQILFFLILVTTSPLIKNTIQVARIAKINIQKKLLYSKRNVKQRLEICSSWVLTFKKD